MAKNKLDNLVNWKPGQSGNPKGRPKSINSVLKGQGYRCSEISQTILEMLALSMDELKEIFENPESNALQLTIASVLRRGIKDGNAYGFMLLDNRAFKFDNPKDVEDGINLNDPIEMIIKRNKNAPKLARGEDEIED